MAEVMGDGSLANDQPAPLLRVVGLGGAVLLGLGSILGTGVFVSIAIAAGAAGPAVIGSTLLAGSLAVCNGLSTAQLAARHPVSGGAYEYGYRWLHPAFGFTAGWTFLVAKSASAATAALGFASYLLELVGQAGRPNARLLIAISGVVLLTWLVLGGIRRSNRTNGFIVSVTLGSLALFVLAGLPRLSAGGGTAWSPFFAPVSDIRSPVAGFLEAAALMFVGFTGYGRIATMAEEVRAPATTIPRAVVLTLGLSMLIYVAVASVAISSVGAAAFAGSIQEKAAPLVMVARSTTGPPLATLVAIGALTAMLGVLLNLILGLSRVALAMARRGDLPRGFSQVEEKHATPRRAVVLVALAIAGIASTGSVRLAWSVSAFAVLVYYAVTNLASLQMTEAERLYPRWIPATGLVASLFLAFWVEPLVWGIGLALITLGCLWKAVLEPWLRRPPIEA